MSATVFCLCSLLGAVTAESESSAPAVFALAIGVNSGVDSELKALRFADDDAALYFELFRALGARTYLASRFDENSRRVHPQAAAEAYAPTAASLDQLVSLLATDIERAHARGTPTVLYVTYSGHGNMRDGLGYVTLEDARLSGSEIASRILDRTLADTVHVIVDACYAYYLAYSRGPGGEARDLHGFTEVFSLADRPNTGLLLSTSAAAISHEWEAYQAGVFSHEVRSGLHGAADADLDRQVTYTEIAAFVEQANAAIPNERYRPRLLAHPPSTSGVLVDLGDPTLRRLEIGARQHAHYFLEDGRGVRILDVHSGAKERATVVLPRGVGRLYLRRVADDVEFAIPPGPASLALASLKPQDARSQSRGAAHEAFQLLFSLPFTRASVAGYEAADLSEVMSPIPLEGGLPWIRFVGIGALVLSAGAAGGGLYANLEAHRLHDSLPSDGSNRDAVEQNRRISRDNQIAIGLYATAGAALAAGIAALLWPQAKSQLAISVSPTLTAWGFHGTF